MDAVTYSNLSLIFFVIAGAALIFTAFVFIKFNVIGLIGDLSGSTARKSIRQTRENNEKKLKERSKSSQPINGKLNLANPETRILEDNKPIDGTEEGTAILSDTGQKTRAADTETTVLNLDGVQMKKRKKATVKLKMIDQVVLINTKESI